MHVPVKDVSDEPDVDPRWVNMSVPEGTLGASPATTSRLGGNLASRKWMSVSDLVA